MWSWVQYNSSIFLGLVIILILVAGVSGNWRLRILAIVFAIAWWLSKILGNPPHWSYELLMSLGIIAVLVPLSYRREGEMSVPYWLAPVMVAEFALLASHLTLLINPYIVFWWLVQILFAFELLYCIAYGLFATYRRFRPRTV